ncbi:hypothetical protein J6590_001569 [Homalodisca vitripennis]|nr:hypothetical protein J6590_001569 [Homalodisca vitripennis]
MYNTIPITMLLLHFEGLSSGFRKFLTIQDDRLRWTTSTRYLGMVGTRRILTGQAASTSLAPLVRRSSPFTTSTKLLLCTSIIRPSISRPQPPGNSPSYSSTGLLVSYLEPLGFPEHCHDALPWHPRLHQGAS